ncbi:uncharacterized protein CXQ87_003415 [Candidozyma duobushaemuli]|uniref:peptidylprolyl isomerase n=2 Tax=Candidozyma TaxID=3303203 RepID=A0ABX8I6P4_9ASCO|nr:uncharacterized protein CXQ87_003415 [[Candida] duobushaemulonis]PVH15570.1 hypothetical protein CXQ87_003415 [[Candida] duobushaemulonis]QWU88772.1 hypothetical protein CA3LBN_003080 [[Candida] haemuloni]
MSVFLETSRGNLVLDLDKKNARKKFLIVALAHLNHWILSDFDYEKDVSLTGQLADVPEAVKAELDKKELEDTPGTKEESAPPGSVEFLGSEDGFQLRILLDSRSSKDVVGKVAEGLDVLDNVNKSDGKLKILHTHVVFDPFSLDLSSLGQRKTETDFSAEQIKELLKASRAPEDDKASVEALALELLGDLSHYKVKPSPQTLFIAKLNPITTENSLEVIFSRFGAVKKANIMKGKKTPYAFVEFESQESAESAYTQLHDNCTIDGHQVVVDFSQSTSRPGDVGFNEDNFEE